MPEKLEQPAGNATTDEWKAYAVQEDPGAAAEIDTLGRDELRDRYGTDDDGPAATPDNPSQDDTPTAQAGPGVENVMPPAPTDVPDGDRYRVTVSDQLWDLDAVEFPHGDEGGTVRVSRQAPLILSEDEADALIKAAGERGFALTKEKVA
jgi:hypothetical protein